MILLAAVASWVVVEHHFPSRIRNEGVKEVLIIINIIAVETLGVIITLPFLPDLPKTVIMIYTLPFPQDTRVHHQRVVEEIVHLVLDNDHNEGHQLEIPL